MQGVDVRLKSLRVSIHLSQTKIATLIGVSQTSITRIETGQMEPSLKILLWYADYFDVSMDYIFCRTDKPQGKLYEYKPKIAENTENMRQFIEMCFDPNSPMNARFKETLLKMMEEIAK